MPDQRLSPVRCTGTAQHRNNAGNPHPEPADDHQRSTDRRGHREQAAIKKNARCEITGKTAKPNCKHQRTDADGPTRQHTPMAQSGQSEESRCMKEQELRGRDQVFRAGAMGSDGGKRDAEGTDNPGQSNEQTRHAIYSGLAQSGRALRSFSRLATDARKASIPSPFFDEVRMISGCAAAFFAMAT